MKNVLVVLGTAAAVVLVYLFIADGPAAGGTLPGVAGAFEASPSMRATPDPKRGAERAGVWPRTGPTSVAEGLGGPDAERKPIWTRVRRIMEVTKGRDVRRIDRKAMTRAYWEIERIMTAEDIPYLIQKFEDEEDPSFRWAMSWLFERLKDDRLIKPLEELMAHHPLRATNALASLGTEASFDRLTEIIHDVPDAAVRSHASVRVGQSRWEKAEEYLESIWTDPESTSDERLSAVESLANRSDSDEALRLAMEVASGPSVALEGDLGVRGPSHPERDLRSPAILAVMRLGDLDSARKLWDRTDEPGADPGFIAMVDRHLAIFQGPDISRLVFDRAERRGSIRSGEARYLVRTATREDVARLRALRDGATDAAIRTVLDAAIINAESRR